MTVYVHLCATALNKVRQPTGKRSEYYKHQNKTQTQEEVVPK